MVIIKGCIAVVIMIILIRVANQGKWISDLLPERLKKITITLLGNR